MPIYRIRCACGATETMTLRVVEGEQVECEGCGDIARKLPAACSFRGEFHTASSKVYVDQLDRSFNSYREMERYLEANDMHVLSDAEKTAVKDDAKESTDAWAKRNGFEGRDDMREKTKDSSHMRDRVAAAREKTISKYEDTYGTEGRADVEDTTVWKGALPGS